MKQIITFMIDNMNYSGGAHGATFHMLDYLLAQGRYTLAIVTLEPSGPALAERFAQVTIHTIAQEDVSAQALSRLCGPEHMVCVPFENSLFRSAVSGLSCRKKIQWIHIDYLNWASGGVYGRTMSRQDGEIYQHFDQIVFVSRDAKNGFLQMHPHLAPKCLVCHNLLDVADIREKSQQEPPAFLKARGAGLRLVSVVRLDNVQKGIARCLEVANILKQEGYDFQWTFVGDGDGDEKAIFRQQARLLGLENHVIWAGRQENPFALMKQAHAVCLFSFYEGIANTVFESMIVGTPVVATRFSGIEEQLGGGWGIILENNTPAIAQGLRQIFQSPQQLDALREALVSYEYDTDEVTNCMDAIFSPGGEQQQTAPAVLVSVVVPVYNVGDYLQPCLQSLADQTLEELEILVVNDGSTDHSGEIIDAFTEKYPGRVFRLDKENGGLSSARNYGIARARGAYIAFIDGDDWVELGMMQTMVQLAVQNNCDMVLADLFGFDNATENSYPEHCPFPQEGLVPLPDLLCQSTRPVVVSACTKLYKTSLFDRYQFPDGWYEDMGLIPILYSYARAVYYLPRPLYHYRWNRAGSIQSQKASPKTLDIFKSKERVLALGNPDYQAELAFAVYEHTCRFYAAQPQFAAQTLDFAQKHAGYFSGNTYIDKHVAKGLLPRLWDGKGQIPKHIFYWKTGRTPHLSQWQKLAPDFTFKGDGPESCTPKQQAYLTKMQAYPEVCALFTQMSILHQKGGIWLDGDMIVTGDLQRLRYYPAVFALERFDQIHLGVVACVPGHGFVGEVLEAMQRQKTDLQTREDVNRLVLQLLAEKGFAYSGKFQIVDQNIAVFPPNMLALDVGDGQALTEYIPPDKAAPILHKNKALEMYFAYPPFRAYAEKTWNPQELQEAPLPKADKAVDAVLTSYGVKYVLRRTLRATLRILRGKSL